MKSDIIILLGVKAISLHQCNMTSLYPCRNTSMYKYDYQLFNTIY